MGADDKIRNRAEEAKGAAKERTGEATGDEELREEGRADQVSAKGKQAVDDAAERAKDLADKARDKLGGSK